MIRNSLTALGLAFKIEFREAPSKFSSFLKDENAPDVWDVKPERCS